MRDLKRVTSNRVPAQSQSPGLTCHARSWLLELGRPLLFFPFLFSAVEAGCNGSESTVPNYDDAFLLVIILGNFVSWGVASPSQQARRRLTNHYHSPE